MQTDPLPINSRPHDIQLGTPTEILASYFYFKRTDMTQLHSWGTQIIADSGAYSALSLGKPIDREDFHEWAYQWRNDFLWCASLDEIGDVVKTKQNWEAGQRDALNLVPTLHYLEPAKTLDWYVEQGVTLFGLGGMVPLKSEKDRLMRWLITIFRYARDNHPHIRFHGWGVTAQTLVDTLPWYSVDSSGFASAFRFGRLPLWNPRTQRYSSVNMDGRDMASYRTLLRRDYGVDDWRRVATSDSSTRRDLARLSFKSLQLYGEWLRTRQQVTAPAMLTQSGPRVAGVAVGLEGSVLPDGVKNSAGNLDGPKTFGVVQSGNEVGDSLNPNGSGSGGPRVVGVVSPTAQVGVSISPHDQAVPRIDEPNDSQEGTP